jgi:hypothetical protein
MRSTLAVTTALLLSFGADSRFAAIFLASAFPNQNRNALIPPCTVVITQFDRLERHHQQAGIN